MTFLKNNDIINLYKRESMTNLSQINQERRKLQKMRQRIYIDIDDVIFNTSEVVIEYLNKIYQINPPKTFQDVKDWNYRSIYRNRDFSLIEKYWEQEEFFNQVTVNPTFIDLYNKTKDKIEWILFTTGTDLNLDLKIKYFADLLPELELICVPFSCKKSDCYLSDGIQIDDNYENLCSNAQLKILLKNGKETTYNKVLNYHDDLYICDTWDDLRDTILFFIEHPEYKNKNF